MIKINQPADLTLTFTDTAGAASGRIQYFKPSGATGYWTAADGVIFDSGGSVAYSIPADTLDEVGRWKYISLITYTDGREYPGQALTQNVDRIDA